MKMDNVRILIVDDDELVTMSLKMILEADPGFAVAGTANSGKEGVKLYGSLQPDLVLMDIRMPDMIGVDAAQQILDKDPQARILFLTTFSDEEYIIRALQLGVKGYLLKQDYQSIPDSIRAVMRGQNVYGGQIVSKLPAMMAASSNDKKAAAGPGSRDMSLYTKAGITDKEFEVIQLVADGLSNKEIAGKLFLSEGTVKNYISVILDKLSLRDRTQLAIQFLKQN